MILFRELRPLPVTNQRFDELGVSVVSYLDRIVITKLHIHFCFINNAVKNQPVDIFENFEGVALTLVIFSAKNKDPVAWVKVTKYQ